MISKSKIRILSTIIAVMILVAPLTVQGAALVLWVAKEFGLDFVARLIANSVLTALGDDTVDLLNTKGRDGGSLFVKDWREFIVQSRQRGEKIFREEVAFVIDSNIVCPGSRDVLGKVFNVSNSTTSKLDIGQLVGRLNTSINPYQTVVKCSIPDQVYNDFQESFLEGGGWETWNRMIQPNNNIYGLIATSLAELEAQRVIEQSADTSETRSSGFTGKRGPCQGEGKDAKCLFFGQTVTPADILTESGARTIDSSFDWLTSSDELSEVIVAVINTAFSKLNNFVSEKTGGAVDLVDVEQVGVAAICVSNCRSSCSQAHTTLDCADKNEDGSCKEVVNQTALDACNNSCESVCKPPARP